MEQAEELRRSADTQCGALEEAEPPLRTCSTPTRECPSRSGSVILDSPVQIGKEEEAAGGEWQSCLGKCASWRCIDVITTCYSSVCWLCAALQLGSGLYNAMCGREVCAYVLAASHHKGRCTLGGLQVVR